VTSGFSAASAAELDLTSALSAATRFSVGAVASQHIAACGAYVIGEPVVAARHRRFIAHPLLHDAPLAFRGEDERVMVELIAVLNCGVVDFSRDATRVDERLGIAPDAVARNRDLIRCFA
jgi:hypothetical protein